MSFLRVFGGRCGALLPRVTPDDNGRGSAADLRQPVAATCRADSGYFTAANRYCSAALASWKKRVNTSRTIASALLPSQFMLLTRPAHCDEQPSAPEQPPAPSPYDLLVFENLAREFKNVMTQDNYDGFRLEADRQITDNIQASHSLFLGTVMSDVGYLYQIGANYASSDGNLLALAKIGLDGIVTARAFAKYGNNLEIKLNGNSFLRYDARNAYEAGVDYMGPGWTASLKGAWQGTWILNAAYTQQVFPKLTLGSELTYIVANGSSIGAIAARYADGDHVVTCELADNQHHRRAGQWTKQPNFKSMDFTLQETDSAKVQYVRRINDRLALATELELTPSTKESALRMGWEYLFRHARVQGNIDSCGRIAMQAQDYSGFGVSGCIDYWNNVYRFGFMMHLLPPQPEPKQDQQVAF
ncbi:mitochondrial import receptor subunit [Babesia ovata]|uniref:Mitochondrial import receptor subunit n=1 Tax=Babesia ovata TaxID=189622 RepID=A0A2H6KHV9_9APIC|nr:mitochondrial import receptor subunit [Babesia ovata]GBE62578.1 mitochondrial import receptor subunit [Babesia ovata]